MGRHASPFHGCGRLLLDDDQDVTTADYPMGDAVGMLYTCPASSRVDTARKMAPKKCIVTASRAVRRLVQPAHPRPDQNLVSRN